MLYTLLFSKSGTVTVEANSLSEAIDKRHDFNDDDIDWNTENRFEMCLINKEQRREDAF